MMATSTIAPATHRVPTNEWTSGDVMPDVETVIRGHSVVYIGTVGSGNPRCFAVPDIGTLSYPDAEGLSAAASTPHVSSHFLALASEPAFANSYRFLSSGWVRWHAKLVPQPDFGMPLSAASSTGHAFSLVIATDKPNRPVTELHPIVQEFAIGVDGVQPSDAIVAMVVRVVQAALDHTVGPEITVDDEDGMDFHLRLTDGLLVMANVFHDGTIDASVYDDSQGIPVKTVKRMPRSTTSEEDLINLFQAGINASPTR